MGRGPGSTSAAPVPPQTLPGCPAGIAGPSPTPHSCMLSPSQHCFAGGTQQGPVFGPPRTVPVGQGAAKPTDPRQDTSHPTKAPPRRPGR